MSPYQCTLCPRRCRIPEGGRGFCRARGVRDGQVVPLFHGVISSLALDPIEKKPLHRFHPGASILSVGSYGCNLDCRFCQNCEISRDFSLEEARKSRHMTIPELVRLAESLAGRGNIGLAYTYNEPLVGIEFVRDASAAIRAAGMQNVLVTAAYLEPDRFREAIRCIDAANIDVKAFRDAFYQEACRTPRPDAGSPDPAPDALQTVMTNVEIAVREGVHVEVTCLVVPGLNDHTDEIGEMARWLAGLDRRIPLHITRFFPRRLEIDRAPTPVHTLVELALEARKYLPDIRVGNV